jgi:hypothetical protein
MTPVTGIRVHPTCGMDANVLATELFTMIEADISGSPRSSKRWIGPSEIGSPCDRRIGYRLAGTPKIQDNTGNVAWKAYLGTALHESLSTLFATQEIARFAEGQPPATTRWHVEERILVGYVGDTPIWGSCDLFDEHTGAVYDWKSTTKNMVREKFRPHGPGDQYRVQAHTYGRGFQLAGYDVRTVNLVWFTRDGEFHDRHVWTENYDEQIAVDALARASSIQLALDLLGPDFTLPTLPTAEAWCNYCPWHKANEADLERACPGHPKETETQQSLSQLIGA